MLGATPAHAQLNPTFTATAVQPLQFGKVVTSGGGSITVSPGGATSSNGVVPVSGAIPEPAEFTYTFTKGLLDPLTGQVTVQTTLMAPSPVSSGQVSGTLSGFTTDMPGYSQIQPGQTLTYTINNCFVGSCSLSFHIGATLTLSTSGGGGTLTFPLVLVVSYTEVLL